MGDIGQEPRKSQAYDVFLSGTYAILGTYFDQSQTYARMSKEELEALSRFSACDISDALLKLKVPRAGFIPDLQLRNARATDQPPAYGYPNERASPSTIVARVSTVLFAPKSHTGSNYQCVYRNRNIPPAPSHYVDHTPSLHGDAVLISAPPEANCAVLGGIMALRMSVRGAAGIIVDGRVRDLGELRKMDIPVWSSGTSTVGTGEGATVWARDVPITMRGVRIWPGNIVVADADEEGVVVIPRDLVGKVIELCPRLVEADGKVMADVEAGVEVAEAFRRHRSSL